MHEFRVFYSWQSDLPNATNRGFIEDALKKACKQIAYSPGIEHSPRLDQDTQGLPGAPSIPHAIMEKIDACQVLVADVSLCYNGPADTPAPNPNVVFELGYAVARLGWDRIILVMNTEHGPMEALPFDLEKRRAVSYATREGEQDRSESKKGLVDRLSKGIKAIMEISPVVPQQRSVERAIHAIEAGLPERNVRINEFWKWVLEELDRINPNLPSVRPNDEQLAMHIDALEAAIQSSTAIARDFALVSNAVAFANDVDANEAIGRGFEELLQKYAPEEASNNLYTIKFDFWRFIGHELFTVRIACLLSQKRWALIDSALRKEYYLPRREAEAGKGAAQFVEFSRIVELLKKRAESIERICRHADLLFERHSPGGIHDKVRFSDFADADLLLFLAAETRLNPSRDYKIRWKPWSALRMTNGPSFLVMASSCQFAEGVKIALGEQSSDQVRSTIANSLEKLPNLWDICQWECPISQEIVNAFDTRS